MDNSERDAKRNDVDKIEASPMFDGEWYRAQYGDSDLGDMMPAEHYYTIGWKKGYNPSPRFDTSWYLKRYKDVEAAEICPLVHYINFGKSEGRQPLKNSSWEENDIKDIRESLIFDGDWYKEKYGFEGLNGMSAEEHYYYIGWKKGNDPSPYFSTSYYLKAYKDIEKAEICPLLHYIRYGENEGRYPSKYFDGKKCRFPVERLEEFIKHTRENFDKDFYDCCYKFHAEDSFLHYIHFGYRRLPCSERELFELDIEKVNELYNEFSDEWKRKIFWSEIYDKCILLLTITDNKNGVYRWRCLFLKDMLDRHGFDNVQVESIMNPTEDFYKKLVSSRIIVFNRPNLSNAGNFVREIISLGKRFAIDMDDNYSMKYARDFGSVKSGILKVEDISGSILYTRETFIYADALIASTPKIIEDFPKYGKLEVLVKNTIPVHYIREMPCSSKVGRKDFRILLASGSSSHDFDLSTIYLDLINLLIRHEDVRLSVMGHSNGDFSFLGDRFQKIPYCDFEEMLECFAEHDLLIAPLDENGFNHAKSNIKFIESAAVHTPLLVRNVTEFRMITDRYDGFLYADNFSEQLEYIYQHKEDLPKVAGRANRLVLDNYTTENGNEELFSLLEKWGAKRRVENKVCSGEE